MDRVNNDLTQPREYDFRVAWDRVEGGWAWVVEIRGLGISVHHRKSYSAAVRLAEQAVADHHALEMLRLEHFIALDSMLA